MVLRRVLVALLVAAAAGAPVPPVAGAKPLRVRLPHLLLDAELRRN